MLLALRLQGKHGLRRSRQGAGLHAHLYALRVFVEAERDGQAGEMPKLQFAILEQAKKGIKVSKAEPTRSSRKSWKYPGVRSEPTKRRVQTLYKACKTPRKVWGGSPQSEYGQMVEFN